eukprot:569582-Rhodomonas_salina.3
MRSAAPYPPVWPPRRECVSQDPILEYKNIRGSVFRARRGPSLSLSLAHGDQLSLSCVLSCPSRSLSESQPEPEAQAVASVSGSVEALICHECSLLSPFVSL